MTDESADCKRQAYDTAENKRAPLPFLIAHVRNRNLLSIESVDEQNRQDAAQKLQPDIRGIPPSQSKDKGPVHP
jgi:hypothetical protein